MWYTYEAGTYKIVKSYKTRGAAKAAITRAQTQYEKRIGSLAANHGPLFEIGYVLADYYHKRMEWRAQ